MFSCLFKTIKCHVPQDQFKSIHHPCHHYSVEGLLTRTKNLMRNSMVKEADRKIAKEKTKKKKGNQKKSFFDELLALQKQQIKIQREQNECYEKMMREALEEQEKVTKRNGKEIDSFFCNLGRFFLEVNNISIFFRKRVNGYVFICECVF